MLTKFKQWYPERAQNMTDREILSLRTAEPDTMRDMTGRYIVENAKGLQRNGFHPSEGNISLAHFFGLDGALKVLRASGGANIEDVVDDNVIKSNPHLRGKSVAQVIRWAQDRLKR
jgi:hypothetical protein